MELRAPPSAPQASSPLKPFIGGLFVGGALAIAAVLATGQSSDAPESTTKREVAAKLLSAGLPGQAAELYEAWLQANPETPKRTEIALSLGEAFRQQGDLQRALRWYYEAEESTSNETARAAKEGIVGSLERLGKSGAAQRALSKATALEPAAPSEGTLIAEIDGRPITSADLDRTLDTLPPQLAEALKSPEARQQWLQSYLAQEILYGHAKRAGYHESPDAISAGREAQRQAAVAQLIEKDWIANLPPPELSDVQNFFEVNKVQFVPPDQKENTDFESNKERVVAAYQRQRIEAKVQNSLQEAVQEGRLKITAESWIKGQ